MNSELNRQQWREALFQSLAKEGNAKEICQDFTSRFDKLTDNKMSGEGAFAIVYSAYGAGDVKKVCRTVKDFLEQELTDFAANHPGIQKNPIVRLREYAKRLNDKISQVCITVDGQELSKQEIDRVKIRLPGCLNPPTVYSAMASTQSKTAGLTLEVSF